MGLDTVNGIATPDSIVHTKIVTVEQAQAIADVLRTLGADDNASAVTWPTVQKYLNGMSNRTFRHIISKAPLVGVPIASTTNGYFVADRPSKLNPGINDLIARRKTIDERIAGLLVLQATMH